MHQDLARIDGGKEIRAEIRRQTERQQHYPEKSEDDGLGTRKRLLEQRVIVATQPGEAALKALLEPRKGIARARSLDGVSFAVMRNGVEQITRHRGDERARQDERADQGENNSFRQR